LKQKFQNKLKRKSKEEVPVVKKVEVAKPAKEVESKVETKIFRRS
jgi:hypothetical protein